MMRLFLDWRCTEAGTEGRLLCCSHGTNSLTEAFLMRLAAWLRLRRLSRELQRKRPILW